MTKHDWIIDSIDAGALGLNDFYSCRVCNTAGGPAFFGRVGDGERYDKPDRWSFIACGCSIKVSVVCEEAQKQIEEHSHVCRWREKSRFWDEWRAKRKTP
jgi:hypothetical protein